MKNSAPFPLHKAFIRVPRLEEIEKKMEYKKFRTENVAFVGRCYILRLFLRLIVYTINRLLRQ